MNKIPKRGDIIVTDLSPTSGREQNGLRPCVVLSHEEFNHALRMVFICPITTRVRGSVFEIILDAKKTKGVVLANQSKTIDLLSRKYKVVDGVSEATILQIIEKLELIYK